MSTNIYLGRKPVRYVEPLVFRRGTSGFRRFLRSSPSDFLRCPPPASAAAHGQQNFVEAANKKLFVCGAFGHFDLSAVMSGNVQIYPLSELRPFRR